MAFADGDGWQQVEEPIEDLFRRTSCALPEALAQAISSGLRQHPSGPRFGHGAESADGERSAEDAQVVVVDLVAQASIARLVEAFELVEADRVAVGHEEAMKNDGETRLPERCDLACFPENLAARRKRAACRL
jgi:hypothetical protein